MRFNFAVICPENFAAKCAKLLRQRRGKGRSKNSAGRGKVAAKFRGKVTTKFHGKPECRLPRLFLNFCTTNVAANLMAN
jgi:hypothetical protein